MLLNCGSLDYTCQFKRVFPRHNTGIGQRKFRLINRTDMTRQVNFCVNTLTTFDSCLQQGGYSDDDSPEDFQAGESQVITYTDAKAHRAI